MAASLNTAQAIGALTAQIEAMNARLDRDREDRSKKDDAAIRSRAQLKSALDDLQRSHDAVLGRVDKIEPVADMVFSLRAKVSGALVLLGLIGTVVMTAVAFFKERILQILGGG